ncbi:MAG: hypothetical protein ABJG56_14070 [Lentilitoribacter sp.]
MPRVLLPETVSIGDALEIEFRYKNDDLKIDEMHSVVVKVAHLGKVNGKITYIVLSPDGWSVTKEGRGWRLHRASYTDKVVSISKVS